MKINKLVSSRSDVALIENSTNLGNADPVIETGDKIHIFVLIHI